MRTKSKLNMLLLSIALILSLVSIFCFNPFGTIIYAQDISKNISITNSDFDSNPTSTSLDVNPTGWTKINSNSGAISGIINTTEKAVSNNTESYKIDPSSNPGTKYPQEYDDKVLMINGNGKQERQGYKSESIKLEPYSYYKFSILMTSRLNGTGSIYLKGIDEEKIIVPTQDAGSTITQDTNKTINVFEKRTPSTWQEYIFFVSTGCEAESVNLELYLGSDMNSLSTGVVFFDHITLTRYTSNLFDSESLYKSTEAYDRTLAVTKAIIVEKDILPTVDNADFEEISSLATPGFSPASEIPTGALASVVNLTTSTEIQSLGYPYLGLDSVSNNKKALVLASKSKVAFGLKSSDLVIQMHKYYKITVSVKAGDIDGEGAFVKLVENDDVLDFYKVNGKLPDELKDFYTPSITTSSAINADGGDEFRNNYNLVSFYVKGHPLYNTSAHLELWLGDTDKTTSGITVFDNITVEELSYDEFTNASKTGSSSTVELSTIKESNETIPNGYFNKAEGDKTYNLKPTDFTITNENENYSLATVVNTYDNYFEKARPILGNLSNPGNPQGVASSTSTDTNNILVLFNKIKTYQTVDTKTFELSASGTHKLSFDMKTLSWNDPTSPAKLTVRVTDENNIVLYEAKGLSSFNWTNYQIGFKTHSNVSTIKVSFIFGESEEEDKQIGYVFLDNIKLNSSITSSEFDNLTNKVDLSDNMLNLKEAGSTIEEAPAYAGSLTSGSSTGTPVAEGGVFNGRDNIYGINVDSNVLALKTHNAGEYQLQSKFGLKLEAGKYYLLKFKVKTSIVEKEFDKEDNVIYGFSAGLTNTSDKFKGIIENSEEFVDYSLFVHASNEVTSNIFFSLSSHDTDTIGSAFIYDINFSESTEERYKEAKNLGAKTALAVSTSENGGDDDNNNNNPSSSVDFNWLLVPSLILGLALIIAIVGFIIRHIKFKKIEFKKNEEYDKSTSMVAEKIEAEKIKREALKNLTKDYEELKAEMKILEDEHKEKIVEQRKLKAEGKEPENVEKEFKAYANKHTNMQENLDILKAKIDEINSEEYMVNLQKKLVNDKRKREKELNKKQKNVKFDNFNDKK